MTKIVGLTGGIASGKSTISNYFKDQEITVIDADRIAHEVMKAGEPTVEEIRQAFGDQVIQEDGEIDRDKLGAIVFDSDEKRDTLNRIVHGEIRKLIKEQKDQLIEENHPLIVLDIPLLFEAGYKDEVDEVLLVYVDRETQIERLLTRDSHLTRQDAINRIQAQMSLEEKVKRADIKINNERTIEDTIQQVEKWLDATKQN